MIRRGPRFAGLTAGGIWMDVPASPLEVWALDYVRIARLPVPVRIAVLDVMGVRS